MLCKWIISFITRVCCVGGQLYTSSQGGGHPQLYGHVSGTRVVKGLIDGLLRGKLKSNQSNHYHVGSISLTHVPLYLFFHSMLQPDPPQHQPARPQLEPAPAGRQPPPAGGQSLLGRPWVATPPRHYGLQELCWLLQP